MVVQGKFPKYLKPYLVLILLGSFCLVYLAPGLIQDFLSYMDKSASIYLLASKNLPSSLQKLPVDLTLRMTSANRHTVYISMHSNTTTKRFKTLPEIDFRFIQVNTSRESLTYVKQVQVPFDAFPPSLQEIPRHSQEAPRYLVFICDESTSCGGWGDRQEGLTFVYVLSRLLDRQFRLVMTHPCDVKEFLEPNKAGWIAQEGELTSPSVSNTVNLMSNAMREFVTILRREDININYPQTVIYVRVNQDLLDYIVGNPFYSKRLQEWKSIMNVRYRFHWAWHELMKPSSTLTSDLEHILGTHFLIRKGLMPESAAPKKDSLYDVRDAKLICAHVRVGTNPSLKENSNFKVVGLDELPVLIDFMTSKNTRGDGYFFVATDYINVRIQMLNTFKHRFVDYGGKIIHTDLQRDAPEACQGLHDTILDQMILYLCDVLIVCKSGFGRMAFFMRNLTEPVYILDNGVISQYTM